MARGFLSGVLWGGILSVGVSGAVSLLAPPPMPPEVSDAAPDVAEAPVRVTDAGSGEQGSDEDRAPVTGQETSQAPVPEPDTLASIDEEVRAPAAVPETGSATDLQTPVAIADAGGAVPQLDEPVLPNPQALAPMEPQEADALSISTEPAQPPAPETESVQGAFDAPEQPVADESAEAEPTMPATSPDASDDATQGSGQTASAVIPEPVEPIAPNTPEPEIAAVTPPAIIVDETPEADTDIVPDAETQTTTQTASARPAIGTPSVPLTERTGGVTVNRLTNGEGAQAALPTNAPSAGADTQTSTGSKPITAFAQSFANPENKPMMGIVLIDDGASPTSGSAGIAALRSFPYPLSFAVDSSLDDAAQRMALYRKEGFEVLAMVDLPEGAAPADAETTFGVTLTKLPEVVGILEGTKGGLQGARDVADQVTAILAQSGHGLITQDKGLNTMPKLARKAGVPADPVFRDFDSNGQTAQVIRRFLDQAAFKAGQEGAVIMLGRLRPDTISALLLWGLQDRAGQVALAPVSAVLLREQ